MIQQSHFWAYIQAKLSFRKIHAALCFLQNRNKLIENGFVVAKGQDIENRFVVAKGQGRNGMDWEFGVSRCKLLYLEWISNEILLYSTGNYV